MDKSTKPGLPRHVVELDGLRGVAILMVLLWHTWVGPHLYGVRRFDEGAVPAFLAQAGQYAWSGVDLFFVLSGFLIGGILLDTRSSSSYFRPFYGRRFFRIVPLYAVMFFVFWIVGGNPTAPLYSYATFTQNFWLASEGVFGPEFLPGTWSLAVEEQFYLTLPLLVWFLRPSRLVPVLLAGVLAAPVIRTLVYLLAPEQAPVAVHVLMPTRADALLLGVLGAVALRNERARAWLENNRAALLGVLGAGLAALVVFGVSGWNMGSFAMTSVGFSLLALVYLCAVLLVVVHPKTVLGRISRTGLLVRVGVVSYGAYLLHVPIFRLCRGAWRSWAPAEPSLASGSVPAACAIFATLAIASVSYRFFEKPLIDRGRRRNPYRRAEEPSHAHHAALK